MAFKIKRLIILWTCHSPPTLFQLVTAAPSTLIQLKDVNDIQRVDIKPFCLELEANGKVCSRFYYISIIARLLIVSW